MRAKPSRRLQQRNAQKISHPITSAKRQWRRITERCRCITFGQEHRLRGSKIGINLLVGRSRVTRPGSTYASVPGRLDCKSLGRPRLEPGTNPEGFRGCSVIWRIARLRPRVADSFFVLAFAQACVLRPSTGAPSPRQVPLRSRTDVLCDCCHAYALRSGAEGCPLHRCNGGDRRAKCKPKPY